MSSIGIIIIPFCIKFGLFKKILRSSSFSHFFLKFSFLIYIQMASKYLKYKSDPFKSTPGVKSYGVKN